MTRTVRIGLEERDQLVSGNEDGRGRPSLPVFLFPVAAMWLSTMASEKAIWSLRCNASGNVGGGSSPDPFVCGIVAAAACIAVIFLAMAAVRARRSSRTGKTLVVLVALFACLGFASGFMYWWNVSASAAGMRSSGTYEVEVVSDCSKSGFSAKSDAVISCEGRRANVSLAWGEGSDPLPYGTVFRSLGRFSEAGSTGASEGRFCSGIGGTFYPETVEDARWAASPAGFFGKIRESFAVILRRYPGDGEKLLEGVVLGNRSELSGTDLDEAFKATGLAHLLAVSGSHLSVVAMMSAWVLGMVAPSRKASTAVFASLIVAYLVLTGMQPSAFRACAMSVAGSISWLAGRRKNSTSALCLTVAMMLLLDPANAYSVGFGLSVMGVLGICVFLPLADRWVARLFAGRSRKIAQALSMTLVAQASTEQISVPMFGMVSLVGAPMNLMAGPVVSVLLGGGIVSLLVCAVCEPLGDMVAGAMCSMANLFCALVKAAASIPHAALPAYASPVLAWTVFAVAAASLWILWPAPGERRANFANAALVAALAVLLAVAIVPRSGSQVVVMDVGQGDAILVRDGGSQVLVDTGRSDSKLRAALGRNGVYHLDAVVLTHFDDDHCGSLDAMSSMVDVDRVVVAQGSFALAEEEPSVQETLRTAFELAGAGNVVEVEPGTTMELSPKLELAVVWPTEVVEGTGNAESICMRLEYDGDEDGREDFSMLLTGDAESGELEQMCDDGVGRIDVLKVGHHGSAKSVSDAALEELAPAAALISVGEGNSYGHPSSKTLKLLADHGVRCWRTDECGDISLYLRADGYRVSCANI